MGFFGTKTDGIRRIKIVGVRTAQQTKVMATYNYGIYSLLIEYTDGHRAIVEVEADSKDMKAYLPYIEW